MYRSILIMIIIFILNSSISVSSSKQDESTIKNRNLNDPNIENLDFKEKYFNLINRIDIIVLCKFNKDTITSRNSNLDSIKYSLYRNLDTISYYTHNVSYSKLFDYNFGYKTMEQYNKDKKKWIEFYEHNKYNNLIWADTLIRAIIN